MSKPFCFVLMPFGEKKDISGRLINFDNVYNELIAPAIREAELEPVRADEEMLGGLIHQPMYERLILCDYAVADLTTANANVFYELGVRHAVRPWTTISIFAEGGRLPFDVAPFRALSYTLQADGLLVRVEKARASLVEKLRAARNPQTDSPVFKLVQGMQPQQIPHTKTDVFRDQVEYSTQIKERLAEARRRGAEALLAIEQELTPVKDKEAGIVVDLFLSYRAVKDWQAMVDLAEKMPRPLAATVMIQEQLALALNRKGEGERAENVLLDVLKKHGPSSETYGILGRIYKDRWETAVRNGKTILAAGFLEKAIAAYLNGFETDWRDAYPGVNALTLMELKEPPDPRRKQLLPVVRYAVERRMATGSPDYWDHATLLEIAVLDKDEKCAMRALADSLAAVREVWEPETTARNLRLIREARNGRSETIDWVLQIEKTLLERDKQF